MYKKARILPTDSDIYSKYEQYFQQGKVYHTSSINCWTEKYWKLNGILDGPFQVYYPSGKLYIQANYSNGKLDGIYREYNEYGELIKKCTYLQDKLHGPYREFHPFFQSNYIECFYTNGLLHGLYCKYDDNSNYKYYQCEYSNGKKKFNPIRMLLNGLNSLFVSL